MRGHAAGSRPGRVVAEVRGRDRPVARVSERYRVLYCTVIVAVLIISFVNWSVAVMIAGDDDVRRACPGSDPFLAFGRSKSCSIDPFGCRRPGQLHGNANTIATWACNKTHDGPVFT